MLRQAFFMFFLFSCQGILILADVEFLDISGLYLKTFSLISFSPRGRCYRGLRTTLELRTASFKYLTLLFVFITLYFFISCAPHKLIMAFLLRQLAAKLDESILFSFRLSAEKVKSFYFIYFLSFVILDRLP